MPAPPSNARVATADSHERTEATRNGPGAVIVDWLACLFMAPLPIVAVADYRSAEGARLLEAIGDEMDCAQGIDRMRSALGPGASTASITRQLSVTYMLLFEGVAGPRTVSLYESAYGGGSRLFQRASGDMEALLQRFGVIFRKDCGEPPDHLSIELALLSKVLRVDDDDGVSLLRDRLIAWVPEFAAHCRKADPSGFYCGASMVLKDLLTSTALCYAPCVR